MKKHFAIIALLACPSLVMADNFAECLLDKLPGLQNDNAAYAAVQVCDAKYPGRFDSIPQGDGRGVFSFDSGAECALEKSGSTRSRVAAFQIRHACNRLYDDPYIRYYTDKRGNQRKLVPFDGEFTPLQK